MLDDRGKCRKGAIPGIKIGWRDPCDAESYLIEVRSLAGLSGSPVFARQTLGLQCKFGDPPEELNLYGGGPFCLLGVMHGHWKFKPEEHDRVDFATTQEEGSIALGLSIAVPAKKILDIINSDEFERQRETARADWYKKWGATTSD